MLNRVSQGWTSSDIAGRVTAWPLIASRTTQPPMLQRNAVAHGPIVGQAFDPAAWLGRAWVRVRRPSKARAAPIVAGSES
jgi:hypothetical protein